MSYRILKILITFILLAHFVIGFSAKYLLKSDNNFRPFPFFSWSLFSKVPENIEVLQTIRILSYDGQKLKEPIFFEDAAHMFRFDENSPRSWYNLFQDLVYSIESGREDEVKTFRNQVENSLFSDKVEYEVVEVRFRPIEFYKHREVLELKSYGTFKKSKHD